MTGYTRIPIRGKSKQRPRMGRNGVYMNQEYTKWKKDFKTLYGLFSSQEIHSGSVSVDVIFQFIIPKSYSKKKRDNLDHTKISQDIDNLTGGVMDALNGVAYKDDKQVVDLIARKRYGAEDCIYVKIEKC